MAKPKYYAVRVGRKPGVYNTWDECRIQVDGYPKAVYKGFSSAAEAQSFVGSPSAAQAAGPARAPATKRGGAGASEVYYAIARGQQTGIFQCNWAEIQHLVDSYPNARYQKFSTPKEAEEYIVENQVVDLHLSATEDDALRKRRKSEDYQAAAPPNAFAPPQTLMQYGQQSQLRTVASTAAPPFNGLQSEQRQVIVYFDGGSRGNPGRAGYGYVIYDSTTHQQLRIGCRGLKYGSTNNQAEYTGMIEGMRYAIDKLGARRLIVRGDSELVVRQMTGRYRANSERLRPLFESAQQLAGRCSSFTIEHVYRDDNQVADKLSNLAMDMDHALDDILVMWQRGDTGRAVLVQRLAEAAGIAADYQAVNMLRESPSFMAAVADLLSQMWDLAEAQATQLLQAKGWTPATGGPPLAPSGSGSSADSAATAQALSGPQRSARGLHTVAVAAVTLGDSWGSEIRRQELMMQQQQQQQQSAVGGGRSSSGSGYQGQQRLQLHANSGSAAAAMQASWLSGWQQQQQQQTMCGFGSSTLGVRSRMRSPLPLALSQSGAQQREQQQHELLSSVHRRDTSRDSSRFEGAVSRQTRLTGAVASAALAAGRLCSRKRVGKVPGFGCGRGHRALRLPSC